MLTKPLTVCGCQPVVFMISGMVAPFARFIIATTSAFLLVRSAFDLPAALARAGFVADFDVLTGFEPFSDREIPSLPDFVANRHCTGMLTAAPEIQAALT